MLELFSLEYNFLGWLFCDKFLNSMKIFDIFHHILISTLQLIHSNNIFIETLQFNVNILYIYKYIYITYYKYIYLWYLLVSIRYSTNDVICITPNFDKARPSYNAIVCFYRTRYKLF